MLTGLAGGALWALDTVILGMALALPVFTGDPRAAILAPFASTFLHDLCSSLWMLGYTGLRRQYKAVWQALRTRGGRFVALGALLGGPVGMTGYVLATNAQALQIRQPVSALTYAIVLLPACKGWGFTAGLFGTRALWIIALSALCGTASYLCYYKALGKLGTGKAMPLNITYAAWSLPFSYLLLHQVPGTKDILCALVVLLGALLAAYEKPQKLEKSNNQ